MSRKPAVASTSLSDCRVGSKSYGCFAQSNFRRPVNLIGAHDGQYGVVAGEKGRVSNDEPFPAPRCFSCLTADASFAKPCSICACDQAANPKTNAGSNCALMQKKERGRGQTPVCSRARMNNGKSSLRRSQAMKCKPAGVTSRSK